jgi:hypothetical protein
MPGSGTPQTERSDVPDPSGTFGLSGRGGMNMAAGKSYIIAMAAVFLLCCIAGCGGGNADKVTVIATNPLNGAVNVPTNSTIAAGFTTDIDPATITNSTFSVTQAGNPVAGTIAASGRTAVFTPDAELAPNTTYTATLAAGIMDQNKSPLRTDKVWTFTTGAGPASPASLNK